MEIQTIAKIYNDYTDKFGIPRQSGLVPEVVSTIIFEPGFRNDAALLGIEAYSHLWLIWEFSQVPKKDFRPTVRPPKLGGNSRLGVFATRSPFRPNRLGLSSVQFLGMEKTKEYGQVLYVTGGDMQSGTPIIDIKPYIPYTDAHPEATAGFAEEHKQDKMPVYIPTELLDIIPAEKASALKSVLAQDPRPAYQADYDRVYKMDFGGFTISFTAEENSLCVCDITKKV